VPEKLQAIREWPLPQSVKALRSFLGLVGFYRRFIKGYAKMAAPLSQLLCKGQFWWSELATKAFTTLKEAVSTTPVLALPNFDIPFVVETDAFGTGVGAVLSQNGHPHRVLQQGILSKASRLFHLHSGTCSYHHGR